MATINPPRVTHAYDGEELAVFLIGMGINQPWRIRQWWQVFAAMPPMLKELSLEPDSGLLGYRMTLGVGGPTIIQYWNSTEKLYAYASDPHAQHRPAWARFNRLARKSPASVGIWHETFVVDRAESIYVGMPLTGLAKATIAVPVTAHSVRAIDRLTDKVRRADTTQKPPAQMPFKTRG